MGGAWKCKAEIKPCVLVLGVVSCGGADSRVCFTITAFPFERGRGWKYWRELVTVMFFMSLFLKATLARFSRGCSKTHGTFCTCLLSCPRAFSGGLGRFRYFGVFAVSRCSCR